MYRLINRQRASCQKGTKMAYKSFSSFEQIDSYFVFSYDERHDSYAHAEFKRFQYYTQFELAGTMYPPEATDLYCVELVITNGDSNFVIPANMFAVLKKDGDVKRLINAVRVLMIQPDIEGYFCDYFPVEIFDNEITEQPPYMKTQLDFDCDNFEFTWKTLYKFMSAMEDLQKCR